MKWMNYIASDAKELIVNELEKNGSCDIWYSIDHVSSSGMTRYITLRMMSKETNELVCITNERKIQGCGMDMVFAMVYDIVGDLELTNKIYLREF